MAITKAARNKILSLVQEAKRLLLAEVDEQLQQFYGIRPDGTVQLVELLPTEDSDSIYIARLLRQRLDYIKDNLPPGKNKEQEAVQQLIREQAFTILNRFASLRMAEERGIIQESIRKEYNSEGFQIYDSITGQGKTAELFTRYKWYIFAIFDELALDLPAIFDRFSPYALIFPSEKALRSLLSIINSDNMAIHREEGQQPVNLWQQDETIGWIYQYYNSRNEIKDMRDASDSPRNSRELAVRNQFFTPRYIVQFLTDNSLGRIWYEMTNGNTRLKDICSYFIIRPREVFLLKGESKPENSSEDIFYIEYRPIKDPREIKMLDPACGSMHFGLYAFDLFEHIYIEAWDNYPNLFSDLRDRMTRQQFINQVPELIIRYNIHGVDIDPRALQIAALSLWLRAQKSFDKIGLPAIQRPQITKSNLVLAEAMPGNPTIISEIIMPLDAPMRKLMLRIWDKMQMAGETGLLLRIEAEIEITIREIVSELNEEGKNAQLKILANEEDNNLAKQAAKFATKEYREDFLLTAEIKVLELLKQLAETSTNGDSYQKLLFADDAARGFAFIELCLKQYDVVLMNPPFGSASLNTESYLQLNYKTWGKNILAAFFDRMLELIDNTGLVAAIFDRTVAIKSSYEAFRIKCLCGHITAMADTGWNVLDANVETTTLILKKQANPFVGVFFNLLDTVDKDVVLSNLIKDLSQDRPNENLFLKNSNAFTNLPNSIIGYSFENYLIEYFNFPRILNFGNGARQGHAFNSGKHFRLFFEIKNSNIYKHLYNGSPYKLFYLPYRELTYFVGNGSFIKSDKSLRYSSGEFQLKAGIGWGKRGEMISANIIKSQSIFTVEGIAAPALTETESYILISFINSIVSQYIINTFCGLHKYSGYVNLLPIPYSIKYDYSFIYELTKNILDIKRDWITLDETCLEFNQLLSKFSNSISLKKSIQELQNKLKIDKQKYSQLLDSNDDFWIEQAKIPKGEIIVFENYKSKRPKENLISIDGITDETLEGNPNLAYEIISNLVGVAFGRWDIQSIIDPKLIPDFGNFFDPLPFMPIVSLKTIPSDYPIIIPDDGILVQDEKHEKSISKALINSIRAIWEDNADDILSELTEIGQLSSIENYFSRPNGFFDFHYNRYTKSRREAPIYWPLSTKTGSFIVWVYYPKLTDQTLYKIVNDYVQPKIQEITDEIRVLNSNINLDNKGQQVLNHLLDFHHELQEFEKELKHIAALPYKPNHNDGVLITAAPLYKLFQHNKWAKSTEACWNALERGEYDWAHLALTIWPDRVTKKCKKDLSMAVAHGLEAICEIKPPKKKEKNSKSPKTDRKPGTTELIFENQK